MSEEKPAVATDVEEPASGVDQEAGGAQEEPNLDALLSEWGSEESEPTKAASTQSNTNTEANDPEDGGDEKPIDREELYKEFEERQAAKAKADADLKDAIKVVKGDNVPLDDEQLEDLLNGMASRNPALAKAWAHRNKHPDRWQKTLKAINKEFSAKFAPKDTSVSETDEAIASAVHSAATKVPNKQGEKDAFKLSDEEWEKRKLSKFGSA